MSRYSPFNSGRRGKIAGTSPDQRSVAGKFRHKIDSSPDQLGRNDAAFQKKCEKILKKHFAENSYSDFNPTEIEHSKAVFQEAVKEIFTPTIGWRGKASPKRLAIFSAVTALLISEGIGKSVEDELVRTRAQFFTSTAITTLATLTAGPLVGSAVAASYLIPTVDAVASRATTKPATSTTPKSGVSAKKYTPPSPQTEVEGIPISQLTIPENKIFVATNNGGDWIFSFDGLKLARDEITSKKDNILQFALIHNRDLHRAVTDDDFKGFCEIVNSARTELETMFGQVEMSKLFSGTIKKVSQMMAGKPVKTEDFIDALASGIAQQTGLEAEDVIDVIREPIYKQRSKIFSKGAYPDFNNEEFNRVLKDKLGEMIFSRFKGDRQLRNMFKKLKTDSRLKPDDQLYQDTVADFNKMQREEIASETFTDRFVKLRRFVKSPYSKAVFMQPGLIGAVPFSGYTLNLQNDTVVIVQKSKEVIMHESLHTDDGQYCRWVGGKMSKLDYFDAPCGDHEIKDYSIGRRLADCYEKDRDVLIGFYERVVAARKSGDNKELKAIADLRVLFGGLSFNEQQTAAFFIRFKGIEGRLPAKDIHLEHSFEIVNGILDFFKDNPNILLKSMPNVATAIAKYVIEKTGFPKAKEAQLYTAMLTCDQKKVAAIIAEDPSILEKTYNQIPLYQVPEITSKAQYDQRLDPTLKVGGIDSKYTYSAMNDFVQEKYKKYQAIKKSAAISIDASGGVSR